MSVFYDEASLVVVPSGYKSGKIYAQKPLTTDGQLTFTRASTATRVNASGLIETVASGVPRLDYLGSTCPKLLLEPQRTNVIPYSEDFSNANWEKTNATITANSTVAPDGNTTADTIAFGASASARAEALITGGPTGAIVITIYAKVASGTGKFKILAFWSGGSSTSSEFTATTTWQRFTYLTTTTGALQFVSIYNQTSGAAQSIIFWGAQAEAGAYATSYIPTTTAAVTRLADAASKTSIGSLIGTTEGAFFIDFVARADVSNSRAITLTGSGQALLIFMEPTGTGNIGISSSTSGFRYIETGGASDKRYKIAYAWKTNSYALYVNGVELSITQASNTFTGLDRLDLNQTQSGAEIGKLILSQLLLFKTRLTNAQLAELTTL